MQWHTTKNGKLTPNDVTTGSSKKIWWLCNEGHEWQTSIKHRINGSGCPHCFRMKEKRVSAKLLEKRGSLAVKNPNLSKQWHPTKNGNLMPSDVTAGSNKRVWWRCEKGHEWAAIVKSRAKGSGCPYCSGRLK
jgi:hypothetical protein